MELFFRGELEASCAFALDVARMGHPGNGDKESIASGPDNPDGRGTPTGFARPGRDMAVPRWRPEAC